MFFTRRKLPSNLNVICNNKTIVKYTYSIRVLKPDYTIDISYLLSTLAVVFIFNFYRGKLKKKKYKITKLRIKL